MDLIQNFDKWMGRFRLWNGKDTDYPFVENASAPFTPARRALPMTNLALISSAGAYIDGTLPFDTKTADGDCTIREIPIEIEAEDLKFANRGYDSSAVLSDLNSQIPIQRLIEYRDNGVIGALNGAWWSCCGHIPNAGKVVDTLIPEILERVKRQDVQAALLIPASRLCHQTLSLVARALEQEKIPTMLLAVRRDIVDKVRPPRAAFYDGNFGSVSGEPNWKQHQFRILDEALRWIETLDQPVVKKLSVTLETQVEAARGER